MLYPENNKALSNAHNGSRKKNKTKKYKISLSFSNLLTTTNTREKHANVSVVFITSLYSVDQVDIPRKLAKLDFNDIRLLLLRCMHQIIL